MAGNRIHETAVIEGEVDLGSGNIVMPYSVITGPCTIGDDNWFGPHTFVGAPPQYAGHAHSAWDEDTSDFGVEIGNANRIREYVSVARGTRRPTRIHDGCMLMARSNAPHDVEYEDGVTLTGGAQVGGRVSLGRGAMIGMNASVHQRMVVGALAMIGMGAAVKHDIPPFALAYGVPARVVGANIVGLRRVGTVQTEIDRIDAHYRETPLEPPDFLSGELRDLVASYLSRIAVPSADRGSA